MKHGQVVFAKGFGLANVELKVPVKSDTKFQSGSMGKQLASMAVMMLVEEGKVHLDDRLTTYFTDAPESWRKITVRQLLTHTSGLANDIPWEDYRSDSTEAQLLIRIEAIPLDFEPGAKWSYSNLGYKLIGMLIGKVTGKFYGDFLQERIFKPLGMNATRIVSESDIILHRAAGYDWQENVLKNAPWVAPTLSTTADGALYVTVLDLARWDAALYSERLVKKASLDEMWSPVRLNDGQSAEYGFGWGLGAVNGHRFAEHGGAWQGFRTEILPGRRRDYCYLVEGQKGEVQ